MKKLFLSIIVIVLSLNAHGQYINLESGVCLSKLTHDFGILKVGYSEYIGVEYLETKVFDLNTNIGLISKGGYYQLFQQSYSGIGSSPSFKNVSQIFNYLSLNTTFELRYRKANKFVPFIGLGPMLEALITDNKEYNQIDPNSFKDPQSYSFGVIATTGFKTSFSKFQIGAVASYLYNLNKIDHYLIDPNDPHTLGKVRDYSFSFNIIVGYKLK